MSKPTFCSAIPHAHKASFYLPALYKQLTEHTPIERVGKRQPHCLQHRRHKVIDLCIRSLEAMLEGTAIGIQHAIFVMGAERLADILPYTRVSQFHTEGDAIIGQEQQAWLARSVRALPKHLCGVDLIEQRCAILGVFLTPQVLAQVGNLLIGHIGTQEYIRVTTLEA